ncbi:MAG: hypothetical protein WBZ29_06770 [Methanocella sp.]
MQSQTPTVIPTIDPAAIPRLPVYYGGIITGYVFDEDGHPVSAAIVTLWQDGKPWQHNTKLTYQGGDVNPRASGIYGSNEGFYLFGLAAPGEYVLAAEKNGYTGTASVNVANTPTHGGFDSGLDVDTRSVNITLSGYRVPVLSQEQQSFTGGIAGSLKTYRGYGVIGVNMSLWQNGRLVEMPGNPQSSYSRDFNGSQIDFLFGHLAPGQYLIIAEYYSPFRETENVTINVSDRIEIIHIVLARILNSITTTPAPNTTSTGSPDASATARTPFPGTAVILLTIGFTAALIHIQRFRHKP